MDSFVFEQLDNAEKTLSYLLTPNGRLLNKGDNITPVWEWEYFLTDHLGNVRTVITPGSTPGIAAVKQINNYYPFGLKMSLECYSISDNRYMFGGKELDDHFGLGWSFFGGRNNYYSALGIWHTPDPYSHKFVYISSYAAFNNNPMRYTDPDGRKIVDATGNVIYTKNGGWVKNAPLDAQRIYLSLRLTETGYSQWNKLVESPNKIHLSIQNKFIEDDGSVNENVLGATGIKSYRDINTYKSIWASDEIIPVLIFEETIKNTLNKGKKNFGLTLEEAIGATAGHEAEHATNSSNIEEVVKNKDLPEFMHYDTEKIPNEVGNKIREESLMRLDFLKPIENKVKQ